MRAVPLKYLATLHTQAYRSAPGPILSLDVIQGGTGLAIGDPWTDVKSPPQTGVVDAKPGDVLFGKLRPYLAKVLRVTNPCYASTELMCLRPLESVDSRWLTYQMLSRPVVEWAVATSEGTKMPRTSWERLGEFRVATPPIPQQRAIADYLDTETTRIDALVDKKKALSQGVNERFQRTVHRDVEALVNQSGSTRLKRLAAISVGIVITPAAWYSDVGGVPALRGMNVRPRRLLVDDLVSLSDEGHLVNKKSELRAGDVVVVRTGQAGAAAVVPSSLDGCNCIDLLIVRQSPDLDPEFLSFVLNSEWVSKQIAEFSVGAIQSHFNVSALKELNFPLVHPPDQREVAARWRAMEHDSDAVTERLDKQIALLEEHRQALITAALTGELEVPGVAA